VLKNALFTGGSTKNGSDLSKERPPSHLPYPTASPVTAFQRKTDAIYPLTSKNSPPILPTVESNALSKTYQTVESNALSKKHIAPISRDPDEMVFGLIDGVGTLFKFHAPILSNAISPG